MKQLKIITKRKDTVDLCIDIIGNNYVDTIVRDFAYFDVVQQSLTVKNNCETELILPARTLFVQQDANGSTFKATVKNTVIPVGASIEIPVYYNGVYKGDLSTVLYTFTLLNTNINYRINTSSNDTLGTITDINLISSNRVNRTFSLNDFTSHFSDPDEDTIKSVIIEGDVSYLLLNGISYTQGTKISASDINTGKLVAKAPNQNDAKTYLTTYKIEDSKNKIIT